MSRKKISIAPYGGMNPQLDQTMSNLLWGAYNASKKTFYTMYCFNSSSCWTDGIYDIITSWKEVHKSNCKSRPKNLAVNSFPSFTNFIESNPNGEVGHRQCPPLLMVTKLEQTSPKSARKLSMRQLSTVSSTNLTRSNVGLVFGAVLGSSMG